MIVTGPATLGLTRAVTGTVRPGRTVLRRRPLIEMLVRVIVRDTRRSVVRAALAALGLDRREVAAAADAGADPPAGAVARAAQPAAALAQQLQVHAGVGVEDEVQVAATGHVEAVQVDTSAPLALTLPRLRA